MSTYTPIATQTLGSAAATVTFSSIPQNYSDLVIVMNYGFSGTADYPSILFNGDSSWSLYSSTWTGGEGTAATSGRYTGNGYLLAPFPPASTNQLYSHTGIHIQSYTSNQNKTFLVRTSVGNNGTGAAVSLYRSTSPITQIVLRGVSGANFLTGSTFTVYGIAAGNSSAKATGGNIVVTDGSYWYHAFTSSGTFIPSQALTVDYLVVAGGGGGAGAAGSNSTSGAGGNGGAGTNAYSSWADATLTGVGGYYAGGGGGASANIPGIGGVGGGGLAVVESTQGGRSGATNTGSGGGGGWLISSGAGGSGLVIVRYAK